MVSSKKILLLACGSFNPPTPMHLRMFGEHHFFQCRYLRHTGAYQPDDVSQCVCLINNFHDMNQQEKQKIVDVVFDVYLFDFHLIIIHWVLIKKTLEAIT